MPSPEGKEEAFREELLEWFDEHRRELPWRHVDNPYAVWVSEIMLQQTQVATVIDYFERWMARFPSVEALAQADEEAVLEEWSGLGYYRRARFLHRAAKDVVEQWGGEIPSTADELRELPGIGPYTAGAVASIAFGQVEPLVDGNVMRVISRLYAIEGEPRKKPAKAEIWGRAGELVDPERPGDFNQGLMELGSLVCSPTRPKCLICPVRHHCRAQEMGRAEAFPESGERAAPRPLRGRTAVVHRSDGEGRYFLVQRRPDEGLLGGLWEFSTVEKGGSRFPPVAALKEAVQQAVEGAEVGRSVATVEHVFSHRRLKLRVHDVEVDEGVDEDGWGEARWVKEEELASLATAALFDKVYGAWKAR